MDQSVIDKAVAISTKAAFNGSPVARVIWIPPQSATDDPMGSFCVQKYEYRGASETLPWDKS